MEELDVTKFQNTLDQLAAAVKSELDGQKDTSRKTRNKRKAAKRKANKK